MTREEFRERAVMEFEAAGFSTFEVFVSEEVEGIRCTHEGNEYEQSFDVSGFDERRRAIGRGMMIDSLKRFAAGKR
jgi:hypothetical protein